MDDIVAEMWRDCV